MTDFWKCKGCGNVIGGHFRDGIKDEKTGKSIYVVECPRCGHSAYKTDEDIEHSRKSAYKRWERPEEEIEGETSNAILRRDGFHDFANEYTETINPKRQKVHDLDDDIVRIRSKKIVKVKPKRKPKKVIKCKCK